MKRRTIFLSLLVLAATFTAGRAAMAHKTVVSKYTFNRDVRPILERRCLQCHATGAPLALQTYVEAKAQSWPLRQTLIAGRMPPYYAEPGEVALKDPQVLTPRELDILMTWASGGTPEGPASPSREPWKARPGRADADGAQVPQSSTVAVPAAGIQLERAVRVSAVLSVAGPAGARVRLTVVGPDRSRRHLVDLRIEPSFPRRYDFVHPMTIPAGSRIEVQLTPSGDVWKALLGGPPPPQSIAEFSAVLELVG